MITAKNMVAQGDVLFRRVDKLPETAQAKQVSGRVIVAHSETGHHHAIDDAGVVLYEEPRDPLTCYLAIAEHADVVHHRASHTHETVRLGAGVWQVRRQREYTPEGWRRVED